MLIPATINHSYYSSVLRKNIEVEAHGTVVIGRHLKMTSGNHFNQELHVENLEISQEVQKAMELDEEFNQDILISLIVNAIEKIEDYLEFFKNEK